MKKFGWVGLLSLGLGVLLAACLQPAQESPTQASSTAVPVATNTPPPAALFQNPVLKENFADPFILQEGSTFYVYATNSASKNISLARSTDLVTWEVLGDAMPALPKWAKLTGGLVWAPEVIKIGETYVMYYTARDKQSNKQCVGAATSSQPEGKFKDTRSEPLVCQTDRGGTIDASPFLDDDGTLYLLYKNDGNCCSMPTHIYAQKLSPDGLSLTGEAVQLVRNDQQWEGDVIEAPTLFKHEGKYYLFFSANSYAGVPYAVGYARCESPLGPCQDAPENPILASRLEDKNALVIGPGHQALLQVGNQTWMFYHAWEVVSGSRRGDRRLMWLDRVNWVDGRPVVAGPTLDPQPVPQLP
mgnify:CR=1 FL=1